MMNKEIEIMSKLQKKAINYKFRKRNNMVFNDDEYASFIIFDKIKGLQQENIQLKNNWNELKKYLNYEVEFDKRWYCPDSEVYKEQKHFSDDTIDGFQYILEKMQELEKR